MSKEFRDFQKQFKKASDIVIKGSEEVVRAAAISLFGEIIKRTPVDTGRLRGNWQASLSSPATGTLSIIDRSGATAVNKVKQKAAEFKINDIIYLTNNLEYAQYIENGTPYIRPFGMVKTTLRDFKATVKQQARKKGFK